MESGVRRVGGELALDAERRGRGGVRDVLEDGGRDADADADARGLGLDVERPSSWNRRHDSRCRAIRSSRRAVRSDIGVIEAVVAERRCEWRELCWL